MALPVVADVGGWTSQGCFLDNLAPYQLLPTTNYTSDSLTPDACGSFCAGYIYFGLEDRTTCYCANDLNIAPCNYPGWPSYCGGKPAYPLECTSPCGGDPTVQCGNALVLNLYIAGGQNIPSSSSVMSVASTLNAASSTPATPMATTSTPVPTSSMADPGTTSASVSPGGKSTSTIYETDIITITSCAPTITKCPARSTRMSVVSIPVAIVIYSTQWVTISSCAPVVTISRCAPVVTNCHYSVSATMVPIITVTLHDHHPSPTPKGSTVVWTAMASPTPGNGGVVPGNGTTPGNNKIIVVSGAADNDLVWTSLAAVGGVFLGVFWA